MKPQQHSNLCFGQIANMLFDRPFQHRYLELLFERLRPLKSAGVPKPDPMTFDGFLSTMKNWNPGLFEHWKGIVRDRYCSSPEVHAIHGYTIPLFPRYMYHVALNLEESEGLEGYTRAVLALKKYLESHGKSVSEELRRHPLANVVHENLVLHGKSSMVVEQGDGLFVAPMPPGWEPKIAAAHARITGKSHADNYQQLANDVVKVPKTGFGLDEKYVRGLQEQLNKERAKAARSLFARFAGESPDKVYETKKWIEP